MSARFRLRQVLHDVRSNLFLRPAVIAAALAATSVLLVELDRRGFARAWIAPLVEEPGSAQAIFGAIGGSVMAVVSIVYSVLVMALTMASMQFSPRIVSGFLRDGVSQNVLGIFAGTFLYSLLALRGVSTTPAFVPPLALFGAIALALATIAALIYFIDHMAREIQVNHLLARLAADAVRTIDAELVEGPGGDRTPPPPAEDARDVPAPKSGYVQLIDLAGLAALARSVGVRVDIVPKPGDFVPAGGVLARISPSHSASSLVEECSRAFDLGPTRTLQQDVAFGLRLIVDVGVKAISPAVNDPSTCSTCVDHLGDLVRRLASRETGTRVILEDDRILIVVPRPTFRDLLDLAFNQLRQYGRGDLAVANRLMGTLDQIARATTDPARLDAVREQARLVVAGLHPSLLPEDRLDLEASYAAIVGASGIR